MHLSPESAPLMHTLINYSPWTVLFLALSPRPSSSLFYSLCLFLILNCDYHGNNPSNCGSVFFFFVRLHVCCIVQIKAAPEFEKARTYEGQLTAFRVTALFYTEVSTQRDKPLPSSFGIILWQLIMGVNQFDLILNLKSHWFYIFFSTEYLFRNLFGIKSLSAFDPEFILFFKILNNLFVT